MRKLYAKSIGLMLLMSLLGCNTPHRGKNLKESSWIKEVERDRYTVTVELKDTEKMIAFRKKKLHSMHLDSVQIDNIIGALRSDMAQQYLFAVTITAHLPETKDTIAHNHDLAYHEGLENYSQQLEQLLFRSNEKIFLTDDSGTKVYPAVHNFERNYGLSPNQTLIFAFPRFNEEGEKQLQSRNISLIIDNLGPITIREKFDFKNI